MEELTDTFNKFSIESYSSFDPNKYYYIVSIDIGIINLGISLTAINKNYTFNEVIWFELIDITNFGHSNEWKKNDCNLYHDKTFCDYLEHIFFINNELFNYADFILIERQPPMGLVAIEQLIFSKFRNKAILISPNSMHYWMGWTNTGLDYEQRKEYSSNFALQYLTKGSRKYLVEDFNNIQRNHDIADSICMTIFFIVKKNKEWNEEQRQIKLDYEIEEARSKGLFHSHLYIEKFRFIS